MADRSRGSKRKRRRIKTKAGQIITMEEADTASLRALSSDDFARVQMLA